MKSGEIGKVIDLVKIFRLLWNRKKVYVYVLTTTFVLSSLLIISVPRTYTSIVTLAPEWNDPSNSLSGSLSSIASSFGLDMGNKLNSNDAISPMLYPDVLGTTDFKIGLFSIMIKTIDGGVNSTYYLYLQKYQKKPWWSIAMEGIAKLLTFTEISDDFDGRGKVNSFRLSKEQDKVVDIIGKKISAKIEKKTGVISIMVQDQDPLVAATMADSIKVRLQRFITNYRTSKARNDLEYVKKLYVEAKNAYDKAKKDYAKYSDANQGLILASYKTKLDDLENEMQLKYNIYSMLTNQLQQAYAKVQERTPAFTTISSATVPLRPSAPRRVFFVVFTLFLSFIASSIYILYKK